jgi:uncharacterized membrane protein YccC
VDNLLFSAKTFAAAMLALYMAFLLDLPRPYWAMATVYIVSTPLAGAIRSKAVYRVLGTLLGAVAAVVLVPNLVDAPPLLSLALALWTGICLYFALLDRTPRGYVFMLASYSAAIIGFPGVDDPGAIFDTALGRVEEITLGIVSATLVGTIVFPRAVGPVLAARLDAWLRDAERWSLDALAPGPAEGTFADRQRLAADAAELGMLSTLLAYDISALRDMIGAVRALQQRMVMLLPVVSAIADRLAELRRLGADSDPALQRLLDEVRGWIAAGDAAAGRARRLRATIVAMERADAAPKEWSEIVLASLLARLRELVEVMQDCRELRRHIETGRGKLPRRLPPRAAPILHRDHGMALLSGFAAATAVLAAAAFWIAAAWPDGAIACQMAAVGCALFAAQDDPVPAIVSFLYAATAGLLVAGLYQFAVLPAIDGFPLLVVALAFAFLPLGAAMARPAWTGTALGVTVNAATLLGLQATYTADPASFVNGGLALVFGMATAALVTALVRSVGAEQSARRLLRASWADLAAAASGSPAERRVLAARMIDRIGLLVPRLAAVPPEAEVAAADALRDLRVGLNVLDLQRFRSALPPPAQRAVELLLASLAHHFRERVARLLPVRPPPALLRRIDRALQRVTAAPTNRRTRLVILALAGVRRGLFPEAPPYAPAPPPSLEWQEAA